MFSEKLQSGTTGATCALALRLMTVSSTKWLSMTGMSACYLPWNNVLILFSPVVNADYPSLEKVSESAIKEKQKFERLVVSKEKLLEMFNVRFLLCYPTHHSENPRHISTTNIRNTSSRPRFPMAPPPPYTAAVLWSISVSAHISPTPVK